MYSRPVERLANVDIAEARNDALIEQQQLDRCAFVQQGGACNSRASRSSGSGPSAANVGHSVQLVRCNEIDRSEPPRIV